MRTKLKIYTVTNSLVGTPNGPNLVPKVFVRSWSPSYQEQKKPGDEDANMDPQHNALRSIEWTLFLTL